jgi:hypothetical protein
MNFELPGTSRIAALLIFVTGFYLCTLPAGAQKSWSVKFRGLGTFSSPRVSDFNQDGVGDIVLGAGKEEFHATDSAVIALDGRTGKMLWNVGAADQVFGSATLKDISGDNVEDVIISGRSGELMAINSKNGKVIWRFDKNTEKKKWYGFYNAQFIPDINNDGSDDILTSNGGNVWAAPHEEKNRPAGTMVILNGRDGKLIKSAAMPDGKETYMSVSALPTEKDYDIVFGTGGETVGGNLFVTHLSELLKEDLSRSKLLQSSSTNGYIGPAVWIDINNDSVKDIVANAVEGKISAFDGKTYQPFWSVKIPNTEAYSSVAPGNFTDDNVPDFFVSYAVGVWPNLEWSKQILVNGANGKIEYVDSLGFYQTSTPVVIDIDGDGRDEAILSVNIQVYDERDNLSLNNIIVSLNFKTGEMDQLAGPFAGSNISTTPWIGDLDQDNFLDIVYAHGTNTKKSYTFDGMQVNRIVTKIPIRKKIIWGSYMGSNHNGIFDR